MEFLVRIEIRLPPEMPDEQRQTLLAAEAQRGSELMAAGVLQRIWPVPGRLANISLYRVPDATQLHAMISSLPLWPWMDVRVEPLALHPLEAR